MPNATIKASYCCSRCRQPFEANELRWFQSPDAPHWQQTLTCEPCIVVAKLEGEQQYLIVEEYGH